MNRSIDAVLLNESIAESFKLNVLFNSQTNRLIVVVLLN